MAHYAVLVCHHYKVASHGKANRLEMYSTKKCHDSSSKILLQIDVFSGKW